MTRAHRPSPSRQRSGAPRGSSIAGDAGSKSGPPAAASSTDPIKEQLDLQLDEALEESFPASDPIAVTPVEK
jgi:hypothetical protein